MATNHLGWVGKSLPKSLTK